MIFYSKSAQYDPTEKAEVINLDWNEGYLPPSPAVQAALRELSYTGAYKYYPDVEHKQLRKFIAEKEGVTPEMVLATNGADSALDLIIGDYPVYAETPCYSYLNRFKLNVDQNNRFYYISNPCNPTGEYKDIEDIKYILRQNAYKTVIVDEAYIDYSGGSCVELLKTFSNLVIIRTFSKAYSLAGVRIGYIIAHEDFIFKLYEFYNGKSVNFIGDYLARVALMDEDYKYMAVDECVESRNDYCSKIADLGFKVINTHTNFIRIQEFRFRKTKPLIAYLRDRGVFVRSCYLDSEVRVTIAEDRKMERLMIALKQYMEENK